MHPIIIGGIVILIIIIIIYFVQKRPAPAKLYAISVTGFNNGGAQGLLTINNNKVVPIASISPIPTIAKIWQLDPTNKVIYTKTSNGTFAMTQGLESLQINGSEEVLLTPYTPGGNTNNLVVFDKASDGKNYLYLVKDGVYQNWCVFAGYSDDAALFYTCNDSAQLI